MSPLKRNGHPISWFGQPLKNTGWYAEKGGGEADPGHKWQHWPVLLFSKGSCFHHRPNSSLLVIEPVLLRPGIRRRSPNIGPGAQTRRPHFPPVHPAPMYICNLCDSHSRLLESWGSSLGIAASKLPPRTDHSRGTPVTHFFQWLNPHQNRKMFLLLALWIGMVVLFLDLGSH
jgi:hypothetical protein